MRASETTQRGDLGETAVKGQLRALSWGVVDVDAGSDTGTDLIGFARNRRNFVLSGMLGVQVKTGPSRFRSPFRDDDGTVTGWWHAEADRDHFDYWLTHRVPHILVLHDESNRTSYWVHITDESVESTGMGAKILVPMAQTIDEAHRDALLDVAMTNPSPTPAWEGSAWKQPTLLPKDRIRHALIAPRLIAPHPNTSPGVVEGVQALAAQVLQRHEIRRLLNADTPPERDPDRTTGWQGPNLAGASTSADWSWRATAALAQWLNTGDISPIHDLASAASASHERVAAAIMHAVALIEAGQADAALLVVDAELADDKAEPADHAWLQALQARILFETGQPEKSTPVAFELLTARAPSDVTVAALASAVTHLIFQAVGFDTAQATPESTDEDTDTVEATRPSFGLGDVIGATDTPVVATQAKPPSLGLGDVIGAADTPVNWWRSQHVAWALPDELDDAFRTWAGDPGIRFGGDGAASRIRAASLISSFAADDPSARNARKMLAQHHLIRLDSHDDPKAATDLLLRLARSGDHGATSLATQKIVNDGPAAAARDAAQLIDPARSIHSTALAELGLLTAAGDVLHPDQAISLCAWAMRTIEDPTAYAERIRPNFLIAHKLRQLIAAAVPAADLDMQRAVIEHVLEHYEVTAADSRGLDDMDSSNIIDQVPAGAWTPKLLTRAAELARDGITLTARIIQRQTAAHDQTTRTRLFAEVAAGSIDALDGVDDVRLLPPEAVAAAIHQLVQRVARQRTDARKGKHVTGGVDPLHSLTLLNRWHPSMANWDAVHAAFTEPRMQSDQFADALRVLAARFDSRLSEPDRTRLIEAIRPLAERQPRHPLIDRADIRGVAFEALASLGDDVDVTVALNGGSELRRSAAAIILLRDQPADIELILALANDFDPRVQAGAAYVLGQWASSDPSRPAAVAGAIDLVKRSGTLIAKHLAFAIAPEPTAREAQPLLALLANHESAAVRQRIREPGASV